jgi:hypothetical protein
MQWQVGTGMHSHGPTGMQQGPTWPHRDCTGRHRAHRDAQRHRDALTSGHRDAGHEWGIRRKAGSD